MIVSPLFVITVLVLPLFRANGSSSSRHPPSARYRLPSDYNNKEMPSNGGEYVTAELEIFFNNILDVDIMTGVVTIKMWLKRRWRDDR